MQQRLAATLVVSLCHQMGACPCGCIEHNYWLQALNFAEEHHSAASVIASDHLSLSSNEHDCVGSQKLLYLNNSDAQERDITSNVRSQFLARSVSDVLPQAWSLRPQDRGPPDRQHGQSYCAMIQVFLI